MKLKLVTYNIHRCIGTDNKLDPDRIGRVLQQMNPDIVALQEVEYMHTLDELEFTMQHLGYQAIPGPTVTEKKSNYGNVLLSRHPVCNVRAINLSYPGQEERGAIDTDIECNGCIIRVIATHLGLVPIERRTQAKLLLQTIRNFAEERLATILLGDMNEWFLWGRPLRWIHQYFGYRSTPATYPSKFPLLSLDKVWCHPPELIKKISTYKTDLSRVASDHLPLTAIIYL